MRVCWNPKCFGFALTLSTLSTGCWLDPGEPGVDYNGDGHVDAEDRRRAGADLEPPEGQRIPATEFGNIKSGSPGEGVPVEAPTGPPPNPFGEHGSEDPTGYALVAGCNRYCLDCTQPGKVVGLSLDSGKKLFPLRENPDGASYSCANYVVDGTRVQLTALPRDGIEFVSWGTCGNGPPYYWQACPCLGSTSPVCEFTAGERVYCGAAYKEASTPIE